MSQGFNLTAQVNLRGPTNVGQIVQDIQRQFQGINAVVNVQINQQTLTQLNNAQSGFQRFNNTLNDVANSGRSAAQSIGQLSQAVAALRNNLQNIPQNITNINSGLANAATQCAQAQRATNQLTSEFAEFGRQSALAVRRFAAFATVTGTIYRVSNAISSASKDFVEFERELVKVAQVTNTSINGLSGLVSNITNLSTGLGVASKDLIGVSRILTQAGLSANEASVALQALARSALAPTFDNLNNTVEGSIALMRQFNIGAKDLEASLGSINAVAGKFAVEAGDIISAVSRAGGVFAAASKGVSEGKDALNEFIAVFTSVRATTRESAETIATGLRTIFTRIQREDTIRALESYGVALTDLQGKFVGPYEAVKRLAEGLRSIDPRDVRFSRIVEDLGGFRQIGKVIPLIQQFTTAQQALSVAQQGQASLAKDASVAQLSLANQIAKVQEEFSALIRSIGQSSGFQDLARLALDLTSGMIALADAAKGALPALTAIFAIRGISALTQFGGGFLGGIRRGGGRLNKGGPVMAFARGGVVPGTGDRDTVPAMLQPGEFVIRKKAVAAIGADRLQKMNKYAGGGKVAGDMAQQSGISQQFKTAVVKTKEEPFRKGAAINSNDRLLANIVRTPISETQIVNDLKKISTSSGAGKAQQLKSQLLSNDNNQKGSAFEEVLSLSKRAKGVRTNSKSQTYPVDFDGTRYEEAKNVASNIIDEIYIDKLFRARVADGTYSSRKQTPTSEGNQSINLGSLKAFELGSVGKKLQDTMFETVGEVAKTQRQKKNLGGFIQRFVNGGRALPVSNNGRVTKQSIAGATLADLETTLSAPNLNFASRKQINDAIKQKRTSATAPAFGLVGLRGVPFNEMAVTPNTKQNVRLMGSVLPADHALKYEGQMENEFVGTVKSIGQQMASGVGAQVKSDAEIKGFLAKTGFNNAVGSYLETAIAAIGAPFVKQADNDPIDFPAGLGGVAGLFGIPSNIPTDVTRTVGDTKALGLRGKGKSKFLGQVDRYLATRTQQAALGGFIQKLTTGGYGQSKPPSPKQLSFLKSLVDKHGVPEGMEYPPKTSVQASALIDKLKNPPKQGLSLQNLLNEYQQIFGVAHPQAKETGGFEKQEIKDWEQNIDRTIDKYNKFANVIKEYRGRIIHQDSYNGGFYALGGPNPRMPKRAELDKFVQGGGFDRKLLEEFGARGDLAFGSSVNAPRGRSNSALRTRKSYMRGYADGGSIEDTVPALLTPGEFVINKKAASRIGSARLHALNRADKVQGLNAGGYAGVQRFNQGQGVNNFVSSQNTNFIAAASLQQAAQAQAQAAQTQQQAASNLDNASGGLNKGVLAFALLGPMVAEQLGSAIGGTQGAGIAGAASGLTAALAIGSQLPGVFGSIVSIGGGLVMAIDGYNAAVARKEEEIATSKIGTAVEQSGKALERFGKNAGDVGAQKDVLSEINTIKDQEEVRAQAREQQKQPGYLSTAVNYTTFGMFGGAKEQDASVLSGERATGQQEAANAAQSLIQQYIDHGKTLQETQQFLAQQGTSISELNAQIVEANPAYQEALINIERADMAEESRVRAIAELNKKFGDAADAATQAQFADVERARQAAAQAQQLAVLSASMTRTFNNLNQSINLASNSLKLASDEIKNIASGSRDFTANLKTSEILQNPNMFGRAEQNRAISQASQFAGDDRGFVEGLARFSMDADNILASVAAQAQQSNANPETVAKQAVDALTAQLEGALGQNPLTNEIRNSLKSSIESIVKEGGDNADIQKLLEETLGPTIKQSQQVFEALNNSAKLLEQSLNFAASSAAEAAKLQDNIRQQQSFAQNVIVQSNMAVKEALGGKVGLAEKSAARRGVAATQAGVGAANFNLSDLVGRRNFLQQESEQLTKALDNMSQSFDSTTAGTSRKFLMLSQRLAETNDALKATETGLQELPKLIEQNINDIVGEIGRIQQEYSSRQQAGAGFAEKLVGSTPQELQDLSSTFNLLNNTLNGNITTIQNSQAAQQAYYQSLMNGQTQQEAMAAAQQAFAGQTQSAMSLFNEMITMSGLEGDQVNSMRADLIENFAKAQGMGVEQNPMVKEILAALRTPASENPEITALKDALSFQQEELKKTTRELNNQLVDMQANILNTANDRFIQALNNVELKFDMSQLRDAGLGLSRPGQVVNRSKGGVVYASDGAYVNYEPRGTDTVPAMLTPGEFVVNAKAARKNLPLLRSINSSAGRGKTFSRGGVVYAAGGGKFGFGQDTIDDFIMHGQIPPGVSRADWLDHITGQQSMWIPPTGATPMHPARGPASAWSPSTSDFMRNNGGPQASASFRPMSVDFTTPDPTGAAPPRQSMGQRARDFGRQAVDRGRQAASTGTNMVRNAGRNVVNRVGGGNLVSMAGGVTGDLVEAGLQGIGVGEGTAQFVGEGIGTGMMVGGQMYQYGPRGAGPGIILTEIAVQSVGEVGSAVYDTESYIERKQAQLDAMDPNRGFGSNFIGAVFGEDASVYRPSTWIPGRGLPSAIGTSSVGLIEGAEAGLGVHRSDYETQRMAQASVDVVNRSQGMHLQNYNSTEAGWIKERARLQIALDQATSGAQIREIQDIINDHEKSSSKPKDYDTSWGLRVRREGGPRWDIDEAVKWEEQNQRNSAAAAAEAERVAEERRAGATARREMYALQSEEMAEKNRQARQQRKELGLSEYASQEQVDAELARRKTKAQVEGARFGYDFSKAGGQLYNSSLAHDVMAARKEKAAGKYPPGVYSKEFEYAEKELTGLINQVRSLEASTFDSNDPFKHSMGGADPSPGTNPFGIDTDDPLEFERRRKARLAEVWQMIDEKNRVLQEEQAKIDQQYPDQASIESAWANHNKGVELKQAQKEREARQAYNKELDRDAKLYVEAARITGVPMPDKMQNVSAFNSWRDRIIEKIGKKFPLTGDPSQDSAILQQYGLGSDVTKALFQPFSPSEVSAVYGSMLSSGSYDRGSGNLVRALQMSNEAIAKGVEQDPKIQSIISSADPKTVQKLNKQFIATFGKNARQVQGLNNVVQNFANLNTAQQAMARANLLKRLGKQGLADPQYPEESINRLNAFGGQGVASFLFPNEQTQNPALRFNSKVPARRARGGMIYASNGMLIPYEPQGTDTVPAMLTPGEFVVNRQATQKNLPLLKSINKARGGRVSYLAEGGSADPAKYIDGVPVSNTPDQSLGILKDINKTTDESQRKIGTNLQATNTIQNTAGQFYQTSYKRNEETKTTFQNQGGLLENMAGVLGATYDNTALLVATQVTPNDIQAAFPNANQNIRDALGNFVQNVQIGVAEGAANAMSKGGVVYASQGMLIPYRPKGTDTVPAMLSPGEFVVNRAATQRNLPALQTMNRGGRVSYLSDGTSGSGFDFTSLMSNLSSFGNMLPNITNGLATLLTTIQQNQNNSGAGVNNTSGNMSGISQFTQVFNGFIQQLASINIPSQINLQLAPVAPIQVAIMGAEVFANIDPLIRQIAQGLITEAIKEFAEKNFDGVVP